MNRGTAQCPCMTVSKMFWFPSLELNENEITPDSELVNDLGINSLELADLVMECEEEFDIEIDDNSIRGFVTVGDVAKYLESVVKEG